MDSVWPEYTGEELLSDTCAAYEQAPKKRGRPSPIEDARLFPRRDALLGALEYHWAEVGWELQKARTLPAIRKALLPIPDPRSYAFELYLYEPTQATTLTKLHLKRRAEDALRQQLRSAIAKIAEARARLERVQDALQSSPGDEQLKQLCSERLEEHAFIAQTLQNLERESEKLKEQIRQQEAYIAQSELLDFITSDRYTLTPLSIANAIAGVTFVSWRTSAGRCKRKEASHAFPLQYEMFKEVERALGNPPPKSVAQALEQVKEYLVRHRRHSLASIQQLRAEWYLLQCAIKSSYANTPEKSAMPFRVFKEYQRRTSRLDQYDQVMLEEGRL